MSDLQWWQRGVFYQVYPRSFADANGDGIGDLAGLTERLDYLRDLGIDGIWLSPHYPSPQFDCGYDISDYEAVAPEYGTLADFERFLHAAHQRDMRVILDLVLNHTSDQHRWFQESRSSCANSRHDWYVWRDGKNGGPPNNWMSAFGGPAWQYEAARDQYYYHFFFKEQPDLNWRHPQVKAAMWQTVRFWLDLGVDGFRLDAISTIFEDAGFRDNPGDLDEAFFIRAISAVTGERERAELIDKRESMLAHQLDQPGLHELMRELRALVDEYPGRVLVGETEDLRYCGNGADELDLVFNFPLMKVMRLTPAAVRHNQQQRLQACPPAVWPCNTLGNHDNSRLVSRFSDGHDAEWARLGAALMLTLRGTPFFYYGEEIGMTDLYLDDIGQFRDTLGLWYYAALCDLLQLDRRQAFMEASRFTRDKARTPMQWIGGPNAGFSPANVQTWLPVHPGHTHGINVAAQQDDPASLLNFYRRLIAVRRATPALVEGDYYDLGTVHETDGCLAFLRRTPAQTCLVILHTAETPVELDLSTALAATGKDGAGAALTARLLFSSHPRRHTANLAHLEIAPFEVYIATIETA